MAAEISGSVDVELWVYPYVRNKQIVFEVTFFDRPIGRYSLKQMLLGDYNEVILDDLETSRTALKNLRRIADEFEKECRRAHGEDW